MCSLIIGLALAFVVGFFGAVVSPSSLTPADPAAIILEPLTLTAAAEAAEEAPAIATPTAPLTSGGELISCEAPTDAQDRAFIDAITNGLLEPPAWVLSGETDTPDRLLIYWFNDSVGAVAVLDYLRYDCGYSPSVLKKFTDDTGFSVTFGNYDSWKQTAFCEALDRDLYEFQVMHNDAPYLASYWMEPVGGQRVLTFLLVMPVDFSTDFYRFSGQMFPELPTCAGA